MARLNAKRRRTLEAILARPTRAGIPFVEIEALFLALRGTVSEGRGSRVRISIGAEEWHCHRPHPGREARHYQVEEAREILFRLGLGSRGRESP